MDNLGNTPNRKLQMLESRLQTNFTNLEKYPGCHIRLVKTADAETASDDYRSFLRRLHHRG